MLAHFVSVGKNRWVVRIDGRKLTEIRKLRGQYRAKVMRFHSVAALEAVSLFVEGLNQKR